MQYYYPTPTEVGIQKPSHVVQDRFDAGFRHALKGGQIDKVDYLKKSFRLGYRAAKLYLKLLRRKSGILEFPLRAKVAMRCY